jgi:uncharacterized protein
VSERDGYDKGVPCWIDHSSADPGAAADFYGGLLGWDSQDVMPPDAPGRYLMARLRGRDVAALGSQQAEDAPPIWNTYVWVESADDTLAKAQAAGGTPMGEAMDIFDSGRMAVLQDPEGAWICLWEARAHRGAATVNEPGAWCWSDVNTRDPEGAKSFYGQVFGWQAAPMDPGDENGYTLWYLPGEIAEDTTPIGGMMPMDENWPAEVPSHWGIAFAVDDTDATAARARELGGSVTMEPFDTPVGRTAVLADPLGASFAVIKLEAPSA